MSDNKKETNVTISGNNKDQSVTVQHGNVIGNVSHDKPSNSYNITDPSIADPKTTETSRIAGYAFGTTHAADLDVLGLAGAGIVNGKHQANNGIDRVLSATQAVGAVEINKTLAANAATYKTVQGEQAQLESLLKNASLYNRNPDGSIGTNAAYQAQVAQLKAEVAGYPNFLPPMTASSENILIQEQLGKDAIPLTKALTDKVAAQKLALNTASAQGDGTHGEALVYGRVGKTFGSDTTIAPYVEASAAAGTDKTTATLLGAGVTMGHNAGVLPNPISLANGTVLPVITNPGNINAGDWSVNANYAQTHIGGDKNVLIPSAQDVHTASFNAAVAVKDNVVLSGNVQQASTDFGHGLKVNDTAAKGTVTLKF